MNEPELFSSGSDIFSKNAKVLFTDDFLSRVKNIIDSPLAHYWKQIQDYILVKFKRQRVIQTNIWCARKGSHFVSFYHSFFPHLSNIKKLHILSRMKVGLCLKYCRKEFLYGQKGPLKHSLKRKLIHVLVVPKEFHY